MSDRRIRIDAIEGYCPVQATGAIDGEPFYFRARHRRWSLSVGSDGLCDDTFAVHDRDVIRRPGWSHEEAWGEGPHDAGWMPEDEARRMIERGAALFRGRRREGTA